LLSKLVENFEEEGNIAAVEQTDVARKVWFATTMTLMIFLTSTSLL
jgi:hypothetical protein